MAKKKAAASKPARKTTPAKRPRPGALFAPDAPREFPPMELSPKAMAAVEKHVEKHVGRFTMVLHEPISTGVHLDVLPVPATKKRPFHTFVTMGMSAAPMTIPEGWDATPFAELCVVLPPEWKTDEKAMTQPGGRWFWPIQGLKQLARLPSSFDSFLDHGHTVPNGDPPEPFGVGCPFVCWMVIPTVSFTEAFSTMGRGKGLTRFFQIMPLFRDEMEFKLEHGPEALWNRFAEADLDPARLCDPKRPSACGTPKKPARGKPKASR